MHVYYKKYMCVMYIAIYKRIRLIKKGVQRTSEHFEVAITSIWKRVHSITFFRNAHEEPPLTCSHIATLTERGVSLGMVSSLPYLCLRIALSHRNDCVRGSILPSWRKGRISFVKTINMKTTTKI